MECTQRLECTQDLNVSQLPEKKHPEQIGFLGICGEQYPIMKGPNKIGRDPQTCDIVLNLNSISRQHAVINILNQKQYMLMDLKSANKTKLLDKTLPPYIPYPLKNGDTVQFGDVFGIFVLLEDNNDLPETQAIEIPETPVISKHISKVNHATVTMIPESPDVSDRDDSCILASQPKKDHFTSPNKKFIKNSGKTITIQPIGSNKIDNVYWNSSKKSCSINLSLDDSNDCLNNSVSAESVKNIEPEKDVNDIHELETQVLYNNETDDASHSKVDKIPCNKDYEAQSIHAMDTQIPSTENLPEVCKINEQFEMQCDLYTSNKKNENSIYSAETESFQICDDNTLNGSKSQLNKNTMAESDEEILFDEIEIQDRMDNSSSQPLLLPTESTINHIDELIRPPLDSPKQANILPSKTSKRKNRIDSDSSTDCDDFDMLPTQKVTENNDNNEDVTDCEEEIVNNKTETKACNNQNYNPITEKASIDDDLTDCEDDLEINTQNSPKNNASFENMITQKIVENINLTSDDKSFNFTDNKDEEVDFEDMPTQVITAPKDNNFEDQLTQIIPQKQIIMQTSDMCSAEIVSPFKIPFCSPIKINRKDIPRLATPKPSVSKDSNSTINLSDDDPYYAATQEIFDDLCSQKDSSKSCPTNLNNNNTIPIPKAENVNDEMVPCSVEEYELGDRFHHITNELSPIKKCSEADKSSESSESDERIKQYVSNLSDKQIRDVVGVECNVKKPVKVSSDPSDLEDTPKKNRPLKFMEIDLPDSQEIKASVSTASKILVTESSSESETENNSEECTPILFRHKKQAKKKIDETKVDLTKRFNVETLPSRVITRNRKPTAKAQSNLLKNKLFSEQENDIDSEILAENLSRLRNQNKSNNTNIKKEEKSNKSANIIQSEGKIEPQKLEEVDISDKGTTNKSKRKDGKRKNETSEENTCDVKLVQGDESSNTTDKKKSNKKTTSDCSDIKSTTKSKETTVPVNDEIELKEVCASDTKRSVRAVRTNRKKHENTPEKRTTRKKSSNSKKSQMSSEKNKTTEILLDKEKIKELSSAKSGRDEKSSVKGVLKESQPKRNVKRSHDSSPEVVVVRRSKRQRANNKDKKEVPTVDIKPEKPKSILKNCRPIRNDQSTVYNISSGSSSDSPRSLKRTAIDVGDGPSSKRAKTSSASSGNTSIPRSTPARNVRTPHVLFTAFPEPIIKDVSGKLEKLGAIVVTDVTDCTVLVTQQMKRTFKLLCAVALGRPIVGPNWIQACHDTNMIVDPWLYLIKDEAAEKRFHFNLRRTLVGKRNFLRGYSVSCTPGVRPTAPELKLIVECSGGTWSAEGGGGEGGGRRLCVSCSADRALWAALRRRGALLVGTEFILCGVLRQQADVDHYLLE